VLKGDNFAIAIPEEEVLAGIDACKFNPHAMVIWPKGSTPLTGHALREGEKNHKKGGLNCVFGNFFFYVLDNCSQVQSLK